MQHIFSVRYYIYSKLTSILHDLHVFVDDVGNSFVLILNAKNGHKWEGFFYNFNLGVQNKSASYIDFISK